MRTTAHFTYEILLLPTLEYMIYLMLTYTEWRSQAITKYEERTKAVT